MLEIKLVVLFCDPEAKKRLAIDDPDDLEWMQVLWTSPFEFTWAMARRDCCMIIGKIADNAPPHLDWIQGVNFKYAETI